MMWSKVSDPARPKQSCLFQPGSLCRCGCSRLPRVVWPSATVHAAMHLSLFLNIYMIVYYHNMCVPTCDQTQEFPSFPNGTSSRAVAKSNTLENWVRPAAFMYRRSGFGVARTLLTRAHVCKYRQVTQDNTPPRPNFISSITPHQV